MPYQKQTIKFATYYNQNVTESCSLINNPQTYGLTSSVWQQYYHCVLQINNTAETSDRITQSAILPIINYNKQQYLDLSTDRQYYNVDVTYPCYLTKLSHYAFGDEIRSGSISIDITDWATNNTESHSVSYSLSDDGNGNILISHSLSQYADNNKIIGNVFYGSGEIWWKNIANYLYTGSDIVIPQYHYWDYDNKNLLLIKDKIGLTSGKFINYNMNYVYNSHNISLNKIKDFNYYVFQGKQNEFIDFGNVKRIFNTGSDWSLQFYFNPVIDTTMGNNIKLPNAYSTYNQNSKDYNVKKTLLSYGYSNLDTGSGFEIYLDVDNKLKCESIHSSSVLSITSLSQSLKEDQFYHILIEHLSSTNTLNIYVNNELYGSNITDFLPNIEDGRERFIVGCNYDINTNLRTNYLIGKLSGIRYWNYNFTSTERSWLYKILINDPNFKYEQNIKSLIVQNFIYGKYLNL